MSKFEKNCEPRKNITYLRHQIFTRAKGPTKTFDVYLTDIKNKAKN